MVEKEAMVAVKVTGFARKAGLGEVVSVTTGVPGTTVSVTVAVELV
jgi:hypothetical protein